MENWVKIDKYGHMINQTRTVYDYNGCFVLPSATKVISRTYLEVVRQCPNDRLIIDQLRPPNIVIRSCLRKQTP